MATENELCALSPEERALQTDKSRQAREVTEPRVHYPPDLNRSFVMPGESELRRLYQIVTAAYPVLTPRQRNPGEAFRYFEYAFFRIGHLGRDGKLNDKHALTWWADDATWWLKEQRVNLVHLTVVDFVCAVVAHNDIAYLPLDRFPHDCSGFALRLDRTGRPATDAWRGVLASRSVRLPVPVASHRREPRPVIWQMMPSYGRDPWR
jgi:hypothetical protein